MREKKEEKRTSQRLWQCDVFCDAFKNRVPNGKVISSGSKAT